MHTADWHLGKKLLGYDRLEEQARFLDSLEKLVRDDAIDGLLVAGDIFDRSVPPIDALALFGDFLERMASLRCPVIAIAGNHDSPERLGFASSLLEQSGVHLCTQVHQAVTPVVLTARGLSAEIFALPFADPQRLASAVSGHAGEALDPSSFRQHGASIQAYVDCLAPRSSHARLLLAHVFCVGGVETPESERPISSGGAGYVLPTSFAGFDYVALGHLHRRQRVAGREHIRYAGSPLQYSVSEHTHEKSVTVVNIERATNGAYQVTTEDISTYSGRRVVVLKDRFEALLTEPRYETHRADFVAAYYTDETYILNAASRLQERFSFLLQALSARVAKAAIEHPARSAADSPRALLKNFWAYAQVEHKLEEGHQALYEKMLNRVRASGEGERTGEASEKQQIQLALDGGPR